ncbi:MAG: methyltransferase domain-containing protein, partial [Nitrospinota bacterium]
MTSGRPQLIEIPFDQYQRYRLAADIAGSIAKGARRKRLRVLDVGGYSPGEDGPWLPLKRFLPDHGVVAVDLVACGLEDYVQASGAALPFGARAFDLVVTLDVLEHVPADQRVAVVRECARVSRAYLLIACPVSSERHILSEHMLNTFHTMICGHPIAMLEEHRAAGLPQAEVMEKILEEAGLTVLSFPSGYLVSWLMMNMFKSFLEGQGERHPLQRTLDSFHNLHFYERDQRAPGYRQVFLAAKPSKTQQRVFAEVETLVSSYRTVEPPVSEQEAFSLMARMITLERLNHLKNAGARQAELIEELLTHQRTTLREKDRHIENLEAKREAVRAQAGRLEQAVREKDTHIENLEAARDVMQEQVGQLEQAMREQVQQLEQAVRDKDNHIENLEAARDVMQEQVGQLEQVVTDKENHIQSLEAARERARQLADRLTTDIHDKDAHIRN